MPSENSTILHGDPEHDALRITIPLILLVAIICAYLLFANVLPTVLGGEMVEYSLISACLALPVGLGAMKLFDLSLKRIWHSGRDIHLNEGQLVFTQPDADPIEISFLPDSQMVRWYFKLGAYARIGRERQIKNGWYCVAVQLQGDNGRLIAHTFVPEKKLADFLAILSFRQINMEEVYDTSLTNRVQKFWSPTGRPELPAALIIGDNGRQWAAERHRWDEGVELTPDDFLQLLEAIKQLKMTSLKRSP